MAAALAKIQAKNLFTIALQRAASNGFGPSGMEMGPMVRMTDPKTNNSQRRPYIAPAGDYKFPINI
jgi:hypothetical protein